MSELNPFTTHESPLRDDMGAVSHLAFEDINVGDQILAEEVQEDFSLNRLYRIKVLEVDPEALRVSWQEWMRTDLGDEEMSQDEIGELAAFLPPISSFVGYLTCTLAIRSHEGQPPTPPEEIHAIKASRALESCRLMFRHVFNVDRNEFERNDPIVSGKIASAYVGHANAI